jgi:hypothetical protein
MLHTLDTYKYEKDASDPKSPSTSINKKLSLYHRIAADLAAGQVRWVAVYPAGGNCYRVNRNCKMKFLDVGRCRVNLLKCTRIIFVNCRVN